MQIKIVFLHHHEARLSPPPIHCSRRCTVPFTVFHVLHPLNFPFLRSYLSLHSRPPLLILFPPLFLIHCSIFHRPVLHYPLSLLVFIAYPAAYRPSTSFILHHFFLSSFRLAGHSSRPCIWRSRWYSYPHRSPLRVLGPQKQMVRLFLTYQPPYFLTRLFRTSFFLAGFYTLSLACSVLIIRYGVLPAVNPPSKTLRGMFVLASVITGFAGGGVAIFFWKATRYCIGAWGGFAFALFIQCFHSGGVIRPIGYRWILYIGKSVCQQITSPI